MQPLPRARDVCGSGAFPEHIANLGGEAPTLISFIFRYRRLIYVPPTLLYLFCFWNECEVEWLNWGSGIICIFLGAGLRLWSVLYIGKSARTKRIHASRLVKSGPFAHVRNPIYLANMMMTAGYGFLSELYWAIPLVVLYLWLVYHQIVRQEERMLAAQLGAPYLAYKQAVPRWTPRLLSPDLPGTPAIPWRECLCRERNLGIQITAFAVLFFVKELALAPYWGA